MINSGIYTVNNTVVNKPRLDNDNTPSYENTLCHINCTQGTDESFLKIWSLSNFST